MNAPRRCLLPAHALAFALLCGASLGIFPAAAGAAVTQPDGIEMPLPAPGNEVSLQELFDFREGAGVLDAHDDASTQPATFRPLCDFSAQLLLRETGSDAAVGWYNVPLSEIAPTTLCDDASGMSSGGGPCTESDIFVLIESNVSQPPFGRTNDPLNNPGQVFTGADIASNPLYAGGEIGFVLLTPQRHYSETRLNPPCVGATCVAGDRWIPTIIYASQVATRGYYMCSEDQEVGPDEWGDNDGDFNDFVFLFTGLVCSGSGEPCDTGLPGVCTAGLTGCENGLGESACRPARTPSDETCNGLNDDCDDETDEGELCPAGELCVKGRCVPLCGTGEFRCSAGFRCAEGACVEEACVDVTCAAGKVCLGGACVGACDDVVCPAGQSCVDGVCADPCAGIDCGDGFVCEGGACLVECSCAGCAAGECDPASGHCVDAGCLDESCAAGQHCSAGACVDDCDGAVCPGGGLCEAGVCGPALGGGEGGQGSGDGGEPGLSFGGEDGSGAGGSGPSAATGGDPAQGGNAGKLAIDPRSGCACRAAGAPASSLGLAGALFALLGLAGRRRQRGV